MNRTEALEILGLVDASRDPLTENIVRDAFRARVKQIHPDMGDSAAGAGANMVKTVAARDYLLKNITTADDFACRQCAGVGMVRVGKMGWRECAACKGSGDRG